MLLLFFFSYETTLLGKMHKRFAHSRVKITKTHTHRIYISSISEDLQKRRMEDQEERQRRRYKKKRAAYAAKHPDHNGHGQAPKHMQGSQWTVENKLREHFSNYYTVPRQGSSGGVSDGPPAIASQGRKAYPAYGGFYPFFFPPTYNAKSRNGGYTGSRFHKRTGKRVFGQYWNSKPDPYREDVVNEKIHRFAQRQGIPREDARLHGHRVWYPQLHRINKRGVVVSLFKRRAGR